MHYIHSLQAWYKKFERPVSSISLIGGFVFDAIFLKRVDLFWENFWVIVHLLVVAVCIILINQKEATEPNNLNRAEWEFWLTNIMQFFFGGLLSTFIVFYFRGATLSVSWPFILILALAFVANERLKKYFDRLSFQISLLFFSIFLFAIFFVPLFTHSIGPMIFLLSGVSSLFVLWLFLLILKRFGPEKFLLGRRSILTFSMLIFISINILYFTNLIPPLPLSLKEAGVYHSVGRDASGNYVVSHEDYGWSGFFSLYPNLHITPDQLVYAYSAIFSPASFSTGITHEWQHLDSRTNNWVTEGEVDLKVLGGRDGGYRTYSTRESLAEGHWRVNVLTPSHQVLGRLRFNVVYTNTEPILFVETK